MGLPCSSCSTHQPLFFINIFNELEDFFILLIAIHKHPNVKEWLAKYPRFHLHFTPTLASWVNLVERFFRDITEE
jgi:hypothetical protein